VEDHAVLSPIEAKGFEVFIELGDEISLRIFELKLDVGD
jgi:hypothetical protein